MKSVAHLKVIWNVNCAGAKMAEQMRKYCKEHGLL